MSAGPSERAFRWGHWFGIHDYPPYRLVDLAGFVHQCGKATIIDEPWERMADCLVCSGCGYEIARPADECQPLYAKRGPS